MIEFVVMRKRYASAFTRRVTETFDKALATAAETAGPPESHYDAFQAWSFANS